jgi:type I restriction enzyme M protein
LAKAEAELAALNQRIAPLQQEINQLTRQFWVAKDRVVAESFDLSASRYRQLEQDEVFYENPAVTLERLHALEKAAVGQVFVLHKMIASAEEEGREAVGDTLSPTQNRGG